MTIWVCKTCGKPVITTLAAGVRPLARQSEWQHADGTGAGKTPITRAQWCETPSGYVKVQPGMPDLL